MKIVALEVNGNVYSVEVADVFSTNDEFKASMIVDFREDSTLDDFKALENKGATLHGVFLWNHIVIDECKLDFEMGYDNGLAKVYAYSEVGFKTNVDLMKILEKIPQKFECTCGGECENEDQYAGN